MRARIAIALVLVAVSLPAIAQSAANDELQLVVALFRHGVRAPLDDSNEPKSKNIHTTKKWPDRAAWHAAQWGELTARGSLLVRSLGRYYGDHYAKKEQFGGKSFKVYLWADVVTRTKQTACALKEGFLHDDVKDVTVDWMRTSSDKEKDPLFHPFGAGCGTPSGAELKKIADRFNDNREAWYEKNAGDFILLEQVLACSRDDEGKCIRCRTSSTSRRTGKAATARLRRSSGEDS